MNRAATANDQDDCILGSTHAGREPDPLADHESG
jgi:hypothetical protein